MEEIPYLSLHFTALQTRPIGDILISLRKNFQRTSLTSFKERTCLYNVTYVNYNTYSYQLLSEYASSKVINVSPTQISDCQSGIDLKL